MVSFTAGEPLERIGMDIASEFHTFERGKNTLARELVAYVFSKIGTMLINLHQLKVPVTMDWVHQLATKSEQKDLDNNLEGIKQLFSEVVQNDSINDVPNNTNDFGNDVSTKRVTRSGKTY
jgi:hypothetical protein